MELMLFFNTDLLAAVHNSTGACRVFVCVNVLPAQSYGAQPAQLHTVVLSTTLHLVDCQNSFPTIKSVSCHVPTVASVQLFSEESMHSSPVERKRIL